MLTEAQPPLAAPAQITIVRRESSGLDSFTAWELVLNGKDVGKIEDGGSMTAETCQHYNVLVARDSSGRVSSPYGFTVMSGCQWEVWFRKGSFENAHRKGASAGGPDDSARQISPGSAL